MLGFIAMIIAFFKTEPHHFDVGIDAEEVLADPRYGQD